MDHKDIDRLTSIAAGAADIQRMVLTQATSGKNNVSQDRRNDIIRSAEVIIRMARELA